METPLVGVIFKHFPLPPSDNNLYPTFLRRGRLIRVPSKEYSLFRKNVECWAIQNASEVKQGRDLGAKGAKLCIEFIFHFECTKLYTKDGRVKKLDVSNRIKAAQDSVAGLLGIDDSLFFSCSAHKVEGPRNETTVYLSSGELKLAFKTE